jgi:aminoglycoside phosphotransferase (APT) family kinase protein
VALACRQVLADEPLSVARAAEQGTFHDLFVVTTARRGKVIVRANAVGGPGRDFALHLDAWAAAQLKRHGLPSLEVYAVDTTRRVVPFDFEVLESAPGRSLCDLDEDDALLGPMLTALGALVARVHAIGGVGFGPIDLEAVLDPTRRMSPGTGLFGRWLEYLRLNLEAHVKRCVDEGAIDAAAGRRIEAVFASLEHWMDEAPSALLHGDLGNHNVFAENGRISCLIDWEDCLVGDPVYDVAFWATFHPERRHAAFLAGYFGGRLPPRLFERRFWLYFLRVALAKTVLRARFDYRDRPGRVPASRRIAQALDRLERTFSPSAAAGGTP